jgi:hypothetical protein
MLETTLLLWLAQATCAPYDGVTQQLAARFGEERQSSGYQESGSAIVEVWVNPRTGTWTILRITLDGRACMIGSGGHFKAWPSGVPA